jgi:hypothetical protein
LNENDRRAINGLPMLVSLLDRPALDLNEF